MASKSETSTTTTNSLLRDIDTSLQAMQFEKLNKDEKVTSKAFLCAILIILYALENC